MAKKSKVDFGKGFKRIYFALAGLWLLIPLTVIFYGNTENSKENKNSQYFSFMNNDQLKETFDKVFL